MAGSVRGGVAPGVEDQGLGWRRLKVRSMRSAKGGSGAGGAGGGPGSLPVAEVLLGEAQGLGAGDIPGEDQDGLAGREQGALGGEQVGAGEGLYRLGAALVGPAVGMVREEQAAEQQLRGRVGVFLGLGQGGQGIAALGLDLGGREVGAAQGAGQQAEEQVGVRGQGLAAEAEQVALGERPRVAPWFSSRWAIWARVRPAAPRSSMSARKLCSRPGRSGGSRRRPPRAAASTYRAPLPGVLLTITRRPFGRTSLSLPASAGRGRGRRRRPRRAGAGAGRRGRRPPDRRYWRAAAWICAAVRCPCAGDNGR